MPELAVILTAIAMIEVVLCWWLARRVDQLDAEIATKLREDSILPEGDVMSQSKSFPTREVEAVVDDDREIIIKDLSGDCESIVALTP